jgi:predicted nucleic acid-binding protein
VSTARSVLGPSNRLQLSAASRLGGSEIAALPNGSAGNLSEAFNYARSDCRLSKHFSVGLHNVRMAEQETSNQATARELIVLDTNVVLDWLVFRDPSCASLATTLVGGKIRWVVTEAMRDELAHVLARGEVDDWKPDRPAIWATWDAIAHTVPTLPAASRLSPRCTDPDDQKFIDLGLQVGAHALLSRDRAVLRCARRARLLGLTILTPKHWSEQLAACIG